MQQFGGNWTELKLASLRQYLTSYLKVMKNQPFRLTYIDAFAGTGYRQPREKSTEQLTIPELEEAQEYLDGSAKIALQLNPSFDDYIFIEQSEKRCKELEKLEFEYAELEISIMRDDANRFILDYCRKSWAGHRAVMFLDPFGLEVNWETIKTIADTKAIDLWLLFPLSGVMRMLKNDGEISEAWKSKLNNFFGTQEWYETFYEKPQGQLNFLNMEPRISKKITYTDITTFFVKRLKSIFPETGVVDPPLELKSSKGKPLFLLCFAAGNEKGAKIAVGIAKHILSN